MVNNIDFDVERFGTMASRLSDEALVHEYTAIRDMCEDEVTDEFVFVDYYISIFSLLANEICERFIMRCK